LVVRKTKKETRFEEGAREKGGARGGGGALA